MRIHRFFVEGDITKGKFKSFEKELYNQLHNVFRLGKGDVVMLCDGEGKEALARIELLSKNEMVFIIEKIEKNVVESKRNVVLYCTLLKRENFEWVTQKATEIGIAEIIPIQTNRTIKTSFRKERVAKIIKEAAEQSGRGIVPVLADPINFSDALAHAKNNKKNILFDISGKELKISLGTEDIIGIWIGPEGGWDDTEIALAKENGFDIISLGALTLRAETAAIIASYVVIHS